ncbi:MAG: hypothetical protein RIS33_1946 [Actinomycetota bacterium]|jgi:dienelactone hydrolase
MAKYDPFTRGPHPVGVRSETWLDSARNRELTVEIWYPATGDNAGADLDPARQDTYTAVWTTGDAAEPALVRQAAVRDAEPLALPGKFVLLSHGYAGHRREGSYLCTHLASHGYVVASADHPGSTSWEIDARMSSGEPVDMAEQRHQMGTDRLGDVPFLVAEATRRKYSLDGPVGVIGISLGGFTAMIAPAVEPRVKATIPLCPAGGPSPIYPRNSELQRLLNFEWPDDTSCLQGVADRDSWLPLYGQLDMFSRIKTKKRMVILRNADHNHFCEDLEVAHAWFKDLTLANVDYMGTAEADWPAIARAIRPLEELTPAAPTYELWRGVCVAHLDAVLNGSSEAAHLLDGDLTSLAASFGAPIVTFSG